MCLGHFSRQSTSGADLPRTEVTTTTKVLRAHKREFADGDAHQQSDRSGVEDDGVGACREFGEPCWLAEKRVSRRPSERPSQLPALTKSGAAWEAEDSVRRSDVARVQVSSGAGYWPWDFKGFRTEAGKPTISQLSWGASFWVRGFLGSPKKKGASAASPSLV